MSVVCMMGIEKGHTETDICYLGLPSELIGIDILRMFVTHMGKSLNINVPVGKRW